MTSNGVMQTSSFCQLDPFFGYTGTCVFAYVYMVLYWTHLPIFSEFALVQMYSTYMSMYVLYIARVIFIDFVFFDL